MNVLVTGARAPIAADLVAALALAGHRVWVADSLRAPVGAASPHAAGYFQLPPPRRDFHGFVDRLRAVCAATAIEAIIPTSEEVFWLAQAAPFLSKSIDVRTSPLPILAELHHKARFARLATRLGYGAPENHELTAPSDLARFTDPTSYVFKPVYSRFASRTLIAPSARRLALLLPTPSDPWLAQTRLIGRELCSYNIAIAGRLVFHVAYEPLFRVGVGASTYFAPVDHPPLRAMSEKFIAAATFTGQICFDSIDTPDGPVAIECNPRGTSGVHLAAQQPHNFAAALLGLTTEIVLPFLPAPRMLLLPLLLHHPGALFRTADRCRLRAARDTFRAAGISRVAQLRALSELALTAARHRTNLPVASTADFEWNGETPGA